MVYNRGMRYNSKLYTRLINFLYNHTHLNQGFNQPEIKLGKQEIIDAAKYVYEKKKLYYNTRTQMNEFIKKYQKIILIDLRAHHENIYTYQLYDQVYTAPEIQKKIKFSEKIGKAIVSDNKLRIFAYDYLKGVQKFATAQLNQLANIFKVNLKINKKWKNRVNNIFIENPAQPNRMRTAISKYLTKFENDEVVSEDDSIFEYSNEYDSDKEEGTLMEEHTVISRATAEKIQKSVRLENNMLNETENGDLETFSILNNSNVQSFSDESDIIECSSETFLHRDKLYPPKLASPKSDKPKKSKKRCESSFEDSEVSSDEEEVLLRDMIKLSKSILKKKYHKSAKRRKLIDEVQDPQKVVEIPPILDVQPEYKSKIENKINLEVKESKAKGMLMFNNQIMVSKETNTDPYQSKVKTPKVPEYAPDAAAKIDVLNMCNKRLKEEKLKLENKLKDLEATNEELKLKNEDLEKKLCLAHNDLQNFYSVYASAKYKLPEQNSIDTDNQDFNNRYNCIIDD